MELHVLLKTLMQIWISLLHLSETIPGVLQAFHVKHWDSILSAVPFIPTYQAA